MPHRPGELAALLTALKDRSGLSYARIGQKTNLSKSAVHRFVAGAAVPQDFGTVERIATACGADRDELDRLYPLWAAAPRQDPAATADPAAGSEPAATADPAAGSESAATAGPAASSKAAVTPPRRLALYAGLAAALLVLTGAVAAVWWRGRQDRPQIAPPSATPQWISGPSWTLPARPVPPEYFGVTINSATGHMPGFTTGAVRLWDSETGWSRVNPARDRFDWTILDRLVEGATAARLPVLYTMGSTPAWAAPNGKRSVYPDNAKSSPPDDLAVWDAYVSALVGRYKGRIAAYELWVLANDARMYTGSIETLVEMTRRGSAIIRATDPAATVVCPGMGNLWTAEGQQVLREFARLGGYEYCQAASVKLYQRSPEDPPETMLELTTQIDRLFHEVGVHPPLWNTGTTYAIPLEGQLDRARARDYAVRFYLVGLLARTTNLDRMYFYNWGGTKIPIVLQADEGEPTEAALAVQQLERWLAGAQIRSCGHGEPAGLPEHAWQCEFIVPTPAGNRRAVIRWTHAGSARVHAEATAEALLRLDGTTEPLAGGAELTLTETPVMIRYSDL